MTSFPCTKANPSASTQPIAVYEPGAAQAHGQPSFDVERIRVTVSIEPEVPQAQVTQTSQSRQGEYHVGGGSKAIANADHEDIISGQNSAARAANTEISPFDSLVFREAHAGPDRLEDSSVQKVMSKTTNVARNTTPDPTLDTQSAAKLLKEVNKDTPGELDEHDSLLSITTVYHMPSRDGYEPYEKREPRKRHPCKVANKYLENMGGELPLPLAEIVTHVVSSFGGIIYNGSTHEPPATRNDLCAGAIDNPNNAVEKQPPSFSQPVTHVPSSDGYIMIGSTPNSSTVPTDPCTVAMETLKKCEYDHWHRQNDLVNHLDTYRVQFDQYCKVNPTSRPEWLEDAFGQEFNKRTRRVTMLVNETEERLRSARLDAKNAGAADPNSPDQTSDFLFNTE
jgi:hypothetical protein